MDDIQQIRDLEQHVLNDPKQINLLLDIKKFLRDECNGKDVRLAAIHSLRRIFVKTFDSGIHNLEALTEDSVAAKKYKLWVFQQYRSFEDILLFLISSSDIAYQAPAIRTLLEFVRREHLFTGNGNGSDSSRFAFSTQTYKSLMMAVLGMSDIDVDILLMIREEVFSMPDCTYFALLVLHDALQERKEAASLSPDSQAAKTTTAGTTATATASADIVRFTQNCLDLLRVMQLPEEAKLALKKDFLVGSKGFYNDKDALENDEDDSDDSGEDDDVDNNPEDEKEKKLPGGFTSAGSKRRAGGNGAVLPGGQKKKQKRRVSRSEQLTSLPYYKKAYSKAWLALLALPLTNTQHKLVLKHIPDHVMGHLDQPLLLADYLTKSYQQGGVVAVLALESLFQLIVSKNLDYPHFFLSLYRLCTADVFSAKYRAKFMKLLSASLKSTNLPAYLVAAFVKRLAQLALRVPSPSAMFCIAQLTWLLRKHPQCLVLLHRGPSRVSAVLRGDVDSDNDEEITSESLKNAKGVDASVSDGYNAYENDNLDQCNAMQSSLWEVEALAQHYNHVMATFAKSLETASSTSSGVEAPYLKVEDFIEHSYASLMETELAAVKKGSALAYKQPLKLFSDDDIVGKCFGTV